MSDGRRLVLRYTTIAWCVPTPLPPPTHSRNIWVCLTCWQNGATYGKKQINFPVWYWEAAPHLSLVSEGNPCWPQPELCGGEYWAVLGGMAGCTVTVRPLTCTNALSGVGDKPRPLSGHSHATRAVGSSVLRHWVMSAYGLVRWGWQEMITLDTCSVSVTMPFPSCTGHPSAFPLSSGLWWLYVGD